MISTHEKVEKKRIEIEGMDENPSSFEGTTNRKKRIKSILFVAGFTLIFMTIFETIKEFYLPHITKWESHVITIIFTTIIASIASYFPILRLQELTYRNIVEFRRRLQLEKEKEFLQKELENSMTKIISGYVPICANCKNIRDEHGEWERIETYVSGKSEASFSHTICPTCKDKLYPEYKIIKD